MWGIARVSRESERQYRRMEGPRERRQSRTGAPPGRATQQLQVLLRENREKGLVGGKGAEKPKKEDFPAHDFLFPTCKFPSSV